MTYDIIILGAGPAGLTAAIYAGRAKMKTLVISKQTPGGQVLQTERIDNYPGYPKSVAGIDLLNNMHEQTKSLGIEYKNAEALSLEKKGGKFAIKCKNSEFESLGAIIATGAEYKHLDVKGEKEFTGRGVSYCAVCDAPMFRNKKVAIIGGGDVALYEAAHLLKYCSKLYLVHRRDRLRATKIMQNIVLENNKTQAVWNAVPEEIFGDKLVKGLKIKDVKTNEIKDLECDGVFIFVGIKPASEMVKNILKTDKAGYVISDENLKTSLDGVYVCGDVRKKMLRQISTAVGDGASAAFACQKYVEELKGIAYK